MTKWLKEHSLSIALVALSIAASLASHHAPTQWWMDWWMEVAGGLVIGAHRRPPSP